jgi:threonylcarbamoyladenosine tRNA methylthiotransferase MtaB
MEQILAGKRVAITTLGCKINQFESAAMAEMLGSEGYVQVPFDQEADVYIINTCTVTARTDAESRKLIRRAARRNPEARIVVTGCYAQVAPRQVAELPNVQLVLGNTEKLEIGRFLRRDLEAGTVAVSDIAVETRAATVELRSFSEHTRAFLQVQTGCDERCSYCIVPHARGPSRSVPLDDVLAGVDRFVASGHGEVVLTGIHLGAYGLDLLPATNLARLLQEIDAATDLPRLRLGSIEPLEFDDELISVLSSSPIICPHFHIPLQSGDDAVLRRMNRRYGADVFRMVLERLLAVVPGACIGADVIAGFPGESDDEFQRSLEFVASLPLAYLHVFPFSPRPGTPAASMAGQLPPGLIKERAERYRTLGEEKRQSYAEGHVGKVLQVLVQRVNDNGTLQGVARNYLEVTFGGGSELAGREVRVNVRGTTPAGVWGEKL